ncbi:DUF916 domain-containing protein [Schleiferilactobacillus perolens]|uniref:DUF916 domain-containing protein n=1 Tax=Schleiferilactobacillus perolens TaxID=100468 RepID=UPI002353A8CC|nr:DUF916 domain-containing protein [Schleiferilactobacillus perolens]MCI2171535.1 DUF916 and DUF3324 domain-containing protein [Schleiferilactobacillus perolens]
MYRLIRWNILRLIVLVGVIFLSGIMALPVNAAGDARPTKAYTINAKLTATQTVPNVQYWEMQPKPGAKETLTMQVANIGKESITVKVSANNAITSDTASIIYSDPRKTIYPGDATSFTSLIHGPREQTVTIPAGQSKDVDFHIQTPAKPFSGMIMGGIFTTADVSKANAKIHAYIAYQRSVVLDGEAKLVIHPHLTFGAVNVLAKTGKLSLRLTTANPRSMYGYGIQSHLQVTRASDGKKISDQVQNNHKIAPNSRWDWQFSLKKLPVGNYKMKLTVLGSNLPKQTVTRRFTVLATDVQSAQSYNEPKKPNWVMIGIVGALVAVLLISSWVLLYYRARQRHAGQKGR